MRRRCSHTRWSRSTRTTRAAPRERASRPSAPLPAKRSTQASPVRRWPSQLKRVSRTRSGVGRRPAASGKRTMRLRQSPPTMRRRFAPAPVRPGLVSPEMRRAAVIAADHTVKYSRLSPSRRIGPHAMFSLGSKKPDDAAAPDWKARLKRGLVPHGRAPEEGRRGLPGAPDDRRGALRGARVAAPRRRRGRARDRAPHPEPAPERARQAPGGRRPARGRSSGPPWPPSSPPSRSPSRPSGPGPS